MSSMLKKSTLYVNECTEFPNYGRSFVGITSLDEAVSIYNDLIKSSGQYIPCIGVEYTSPVMHIKDQHCDVISGRCINLDNINSCALPDDALELVDSLIDRFPDKFTVGECPRLDEFLARTGKGGR